MGWLREFFRGFDVCGFCPPLAPIDEFPNCTEKSTGPQSWQDEEEPILRIAYWRDRCFLAERLIGKTLTQQEVGRARHIMGLEDKSQRQREEITSMRMIAEYRNRQLEAANLIVRCNGGCTGGIIGSPEKINEELVAEVERTAKRLREWWRNYQYRQKNP